MTITDFVGPKGYIHGWIFVGVPGVTPHSELLKMRKEARESLPAGHVERLKAERAVRESRKLRSQELPSAVIKEPPTAVASEPKFDPALEAEQFREKSPEFASYDMDTRQRKSATRSINSLRRHLFTYAPELANDTHIRIVRPLDLLTAEEESEGKRPHSVMGDYRSRRSLPGIIRTASTIFPAYDNQRTLDDVLDKVKKSNWWVPTDPKWSLSDNVLAHEFGHGVATSVFNNRTLDRRMQLALFRSFGRNYGLSTY